MKVCKQGHRFEGPRCKKCQSEKNASYYVRDREEILAQAKQDRELFKELKARFTEEKIAAS